MNHGLLWQKHSSLPPVTINNSFYFSVHLLFCLPLPLSRKLPLHLQSMATSGAQKGFVSIYWLLHKALFWVAKTIIYNFQLSVQFCSLINVKEGRKEGRKEGYEISWKWEDRLLSPQKWTVSSIAHASSQNEKGNNWCSAEQPSACRSKGPFLPTGLKAFAMFLKTFLWKWEKHYGHLKRSS